VVEDKSWALSLPWSFWKPFAPAVKTLLSLQHFVFVTLPLHT
jgi:hypothetical protein